MSSTVAISIFVVIGIVMAMILYSTRIMVEEPNIGILYRFKKIRFKRLTPGLHFYARSVLGMEWYKVVMVPGRLIQIKIRPDTAQTQNVPVKLDIEIFIRLQLDSDGFPTFEAGQNFLNWIQISGYETMLGQMTPDGYESGAIDRVLQAFVEGKVTEVITQYKPETITANPQVFQQLQQAIWNELIPFISSWAGELYVKVQQLSVPDEEAREKQIRDSKAAATSERTIQDAKIDILKKYRDELGPKYALLYASKDALEGANVTLLGSDLPDAIGGLIGKKLQQKQATRNARRKKARGAPWEVL